MTTDTFLAGVPFELTLHVVEEDLDDRAHVNNVVYLKWVQDAAAAHWRRLAPDGAHAEIAWVALRHEIDYLSPAVLGDEITLRTWVGVARGLSFERFTEIGRRSDGHVLAKARTLWCPVDARTGKPRRVSDDIRARCSAELHPGARSGSKREAFATPSRTSKAASASEQLRERSARPEDQR